MKPPQYEWNGIFRFSEAEKELIGRINSFLTRPLSPRWIYYGLYDIPDAKKQRELNKVLNKARKDQRQPINRDLITDDTGSFNSSILGSFFEEMIGTFKYRRYLINYKL